MIDLFDISEEITLEEACRILGVSVATGRNWIKTGLIVPVQNTKELRVNKIEVLDLLDKIKNNKIDRLKSRRNKTKVNGNVVSKKYLDDSESYKIVLQIANDIDGKHLDENDHRIILAEYALKLYHSMNKIKFEENQILLLNYDDSIIINTFIKELIFPIKHLKQYVSRNEAYIKHHVRYNKEDFLGLLYMALQNLKNRKSTGVYFTPSKIVDAMVQNLTNSNSLIDKKIVDPCCGTGNFLIKIASYCDNANGIYGFDIDNISVILTKINLYLISPMTEIDVINKNVQCTNSLKIDERNKFDICIGNPPWGSDLEDDIEYLNANFESSRKGSYEAFTLFIEKGIKILEEDGYLSYVVPESLLNVGIHQLIREYLLERTKLSSIIFWGNAFDNVQTPAISFEVIKQKTNFFTYDATITNETTFIIKDKRITDSNLWSFQNNDYDNNLLNKIEENGGKRLKNNADFALGIVTGNNKKYLMKEQSLNSVPILKGSDIYKFKHNIAQNFVVYEPEKWQQVAKESFYFSDEKLFYRFISDTLVFAYDDKKTLSLNSCNILIPRIKDLDIKYIMAILNSRIAHFYFKAKFKSVKILRNHIESIPIFDADENQQRDIIELVDQFIDSDNNDEKVIIYDKIDIKIMALYSLDESDQTHIKNYNNKNLFLYK